MKLTIRDYRPADLDMLYEIDRACFEPGVAYSRRMIREFLGLPLARCQIACLGDEIAGFIITASAGARAHIITIDIAGPARRQGTGSALLARAERRLTADGVRWIDLETATTNQPAIAFWEKHGYRITGIARGYYAGRIDAYLMRKRLATPTAAD